MQDNERFWQTLFASRTSSTAEIERDLREQGAKNVYYDDARIYYALQIFADKEASEGDKAREEFLLVRDNIVKYCARNDKEVYIIKNDGDRSGGTEIKFKFLSENFPKISENNSEIRYLDRRVGNCHEGAFLLANAFDEDFEVVTGAVHSITDMEKYYHTWIDFGDYVADYTINGYMPKETFECLFHPDEVLTRIPKEKILKDRDFMLDEYNARGFIREDYISSSVEYNAFLKFYYMTHGLIEEDLKRNDFLFKDQSVK